jgi:uncharacterized protein (DUF2062 family)
MKNSWQKIKNFFLYFFTLKDTPHNIATGAALGIFLGIVPGEGLATTLILASLLKINRAAATAGVLATNMWGTFIVLPLVTIVGGFLFGMAPGSLTEQFNQTYHLGLRFFLSKAIFFDLALPLIVGFILVAGTISLVFYLIIYFFLKYRKEKQQ